MVDVEPKNTAVAEFPFEKYISSPRSCTNHEWLVEAEASFFRLDVFDRDHLALGVLEGNVALGAVTRHQFHQREHDQ